MPGILLEWISVTPVPVARLWQGCWMQTSNHNLQAQATLPCKSQLGKILFQRFCRILWLAGRTISHRPCTECGLENTLCIHCFCLGSSFIVPSLLCPFSCDELKVDLLEKNCFFSHQLCVQLKPESWASPEGPIWYCPGRAQDTVFCRASSPSFSKHPNSFPGKESLPGVSTSPCSSVCHSEPKVTAAERGELHFPSHLLHCCFYCLWLSARALKTEGVF